GHPEFRADDIPLDDERSYDLLCRGDTEGVFQMESSGMTDLVMKLRPRKFTEVIPLIALYRPGPLGSGMVDDYVSRKHGRTKVEYMVPELEAITAETLGVIVYQDQVLQIANQLGGYTLGEADLLRRAMGKKKVEEMAKHETKFVEGCKANGIDPAKAKRIFELMAEFAGYGFPKAHSTAYALITYQTAWLKANYPREFLAALMSIEAGNHDKLARYIAHARERKIDVLGPCVNESESDFTPVAEGIRFGLSGVKNVGQGAIESVLAVRKDDGEFKSLWDFTNRVDARKVNRRVVESLVKCGAFDSVSPERSRLWAGLDTALESGAKAQRDREVGQESLFGELTGVETSEPALPDAAPWADQEKLSYEKEVLGFYVTGHPLQAFAPLLGKLADTSATTAAEKVGRDVRVGGVLTTLRETRTRRGQAMGFGTLEDLEGVFELVIFPEAYAQSRELLRRGLGDETEGRPVPLLVSGTLESAEPAKILIREIHELERAEESLAAQLHIQLQADEASRDRLSALKSVLGAHPGDCAVQVHLFIPGESETVLALPGRRGVDASEALMKDLDGLFGRRVAELSL
nr:DNA polymerase III subunit alpha [Myxococcota bacterium]